MQTGTELTIQLPDSVRKIIGALEDAGHEAFAVGGCVRDSLLGREPGDWDVTTSATPGEIKSIFRRTVDTGIEHGTVTVLMDRQSFEVTTYRVDGEYKDSRHPESVTFTASLKEDLRRRDFTINAMAYNDRNGLVDLFEGQKDLERRLIRCVGDPEERFGEDALRILRAVRFAAQLDFAIDPATREAILRHAPRLAAVSKERILTELSKLVCSAHIEKTAELKELGLTDYMADWFGEVRTEHLQELKESADSGSLEALWQEAAELSAWTRAVPEADDEAEDLYGDGHDHDAMKHLCLADPEETRADLEDDLRHKHGGHTHGGEGQTGGKSSGKSKAAGASGGQPPMNNILALFGLPQPKAEEEEPEEKEDVSALFAAYDLTKSVPISKRGVRYAFLLQGMDKVHAGALMKALKADNATLRQAVLLSVRSLEPLPQDRYELKKIMAEIPPELFRDLLYVKLASSGTALYRERCQGEDLMETIRVYEDIMEIGEPYCLKDLVLTGNDLIGLGAAEGPEVGRILARMLDAVQKDPQINTMMYLISNYYRLK